MSYYQLHFWVSLAAMEMGVVGKDMTTYLGILDTTRGKSYIGHHVIRVVDDKTEPIILQMDNE